MTITWIYTDDVHTELNSDTRIAKEYEPGSSDVLLERPFNEYENEVADRAVVREEEAANKSTIEVNLEEDLEAMQLIIDQPNADLRLDPSQEIKDIARATRRLIRIAIDDFSGTE